jgi:hypothetical protein
MHSHTGPRGGSFLPTMHNKRMTATEQINDVHKQINETRAEMNDALE